MADAREYIRRRLLPDVCSYSVFPNSSISVVRKGLPVTCRDLFNLFSNFWGLAILKKLNTETSVFRTKFGIVMLYHNIDVL